MPEELIRITIPVAYNVAGQRAGGLNLNDEPVGFKGSFSPYMKNMVVESTRVRKRQGYSRLGTGAAMSGVGMALVSYTDAQATVHLIALTTTSAYQYNSATDTWDDVSMAGEGGPWTGDQDNIFGFDVVTDATEFAANGGSALCVVNNTDDVKYFEGDAGDTFAVLDHDFTSFASCRDLVEFWNHLMFLGYTDTATRGRSFGFAAFANVDDFTSATSGISTLTDTVGVILKGAKLGNDLIIYSERSISRCQYVGGAVIFVTPVIVQGAGLLSETSICNTTKMHFFLGTDQKVYAMYPGGELTDVGKRVDSLLFSSILMSIKNRVACGYDVGKKKVLIAIPTAGDTYANKLYVLNADLDGSPWEYYEFAHDVRAIATLKRTKSSGYFDDTEWTTKYFDELPGYFDDVYGVEGYDMCCFLTSTGYVYKIDEATGYDDTSEINCEYQTEDIIFGDEEDFFRSLWFSFTAKSVYASISCYVYYSTDVGDTWISLADSPVTLQQAWTTHRLPLDVTARMIRFRLVQQGKGDLQLRSNFRLEVSPSTARD